MAIFLLIHVPLMLWLPCPWLNTYMPRTEQFAVCTDMRSLLIKAANFGRVWKHDLLHILRRKILFFAVKAMACEGVVSVGVEEQMNRPIQARWWLALLPYTGACWHPCWWDCCYWVWTGTFWPGIQIPCTTASKDISQTQSSMTMELYGLKNVQMEMWTKPWRKYEQVSWIYFCSDRTNKWWLPFTDSLTAPMQGLPSAISIRGLVDAASPTVLWDMSVRSEPGSTAVWHAGDGYKLWSSSEEPDLLSQASNSLGSMSVILGPG